MNAESFAILMERYFDGALPARDEAVLAAAVRADPERRVLFERQAALHLQIGEYHRDYAEADLARRVDLVLADARADSRLSATQVLKRAGKERRRAVSRTRRAARPGRARSAAARRLPVRVQRAGGRRLGLWTAALAAAVLAAVGVTHRAELSDWAAQRWPARFGAPRLAQLAAVQGEAYVVAGAVQREAKPGQPIRQDDWLLTRAGASAAVRYPDATWLRLEQATDLQFRAAADRASELTPAKALYVRCGVLTADVRPQPAAAPMTVGSPHADLVVLGTQFRMTVSADATRVDVMAGSVRLSNRLSGESLVVSARASAVAGPGTRLAAGPGRTAQPPGRKPAERAAEARPLVRYEFQEGGGPLVRDTAGLQPGLDLLIRDPAATRWLPGGGLALVRPTVLRSRQKATRVTQACMASGAVSIELWVRHYPIPNEPEYPHIITLVPVSTKANFTLGLNRDARGRPIYKGSLRTPRRMYEGMEETVSPAGCVSAGLTHVVYTRDASGENRLHIDGHDRTDRARSASGTGYDLSVWLGDVYMVLGNEINGIFPWLGELHFVAVYDRALSADEVRLHYARGPRGRGTPAGRDSAALERRPANAEARVPAG
ncbi:MAG: FecR domain-containing protein [Kiritimatiellae bacterium]|nr:FecR domain-containing protein [Kiritimatiellia bacterium]